MVSRAIAQSSNSTVPSRTSAMPERQFMGLAAQFQKLRARGVAIRRLGKPLAAERQRLVGAEHQPPRHASPKPPSLFRARASIATLRGSLAAAFLLDPALVDIGRHDFDRQARGLQNVRRTSLFEASTSGSEQQPERHDDQATGCRRRSARSLSTAAAVSSIERRDTSINSQ